MTATIAKPQSATSGQPASISSPAPSLLRPRPHPILAFPLRPEEIDRLLYDTPNGAAIYARVLSLFNQQIAEAAWDENVPRASDPYRGTLELPHWKDADFVLGIGPKPGSAAVASPGGRRGEGTGDGVAAAAGHGDRAALPRWNAAGERTLASLAGLRDNWLACPYVAALPPELQASLGRLPEELLTILCNLLILLGGNRSGKSEYCAKRCMESAIENPGSTQFCVAGEDLNQSLDNQQRLIWKYLPVEWKGLNGKRDPRGIYHINYSRKGGFTLERVILPNGSTFLFYGSQSQTHDVIQGKPCGHPDRRCIGGWGDESVVLPWWKQMITRAGYYNAILLWSFTPIDGMTPAIKDLVGEARTILSLFAEMMSDRKHVEDCPRQHMPYLQVPRQPSAMVMYFHTQLSPFGAGGRSFYEALKTNHAKSTDELKGRFTYGYTKDVGGRKFPAYGPQNVVPVHRLPAVGTLRTFNDPHGSRPWFTWWVLTTPGKDPSHYVVREWPDQATYGEWAVPSTRPVDSSSRKGWDGDPGPAQRPNGWGIADYKALWAERERVEVPWALREWLKVNKGRRVLGNVQRPTSNVQRSTGEAESLSQLDDFLAAIKYPWHRHRIKEAIRDGLDLATLDEGIFERYFDARFLNADYADDEGGTCLRYKLEEEQKHPETGAVLPGCDNIREATGNRLEIGYGMVSDLLAWNRLHPDGLVPGYNAPHLYVSEECTQTRWAFENFTGLAGETGACKEPMDLARHLAEAEPTYVEETTFQIRSQRERHED
jgi:hypothetical protein